MRWFKFLSLTLFFIFQQRHDPQSLTINLKPLESNHNVSQASYQLNDEQRKRLLKLLQASQAEKSEIKKLCPFIPEFVFYLNNKEPTSFQQVAIFVSFSCEQIKITDLEGKAQLIDVSQELIESYQHLIQEIL